MSDFGKELTITAMVAIWIGLAVIMVGYSGARYIEQHQPDHRFVCVEGIVLKAGQGNHVCAIVVGQPTRELFED